MAKWQIMKMLPAHGGDLCERQKNEERSITGKQTNQQEKTNKQRNERSITDKQTNERLITDKQTNRNFGGKPLLAVWTERIKAVWDCFHNKLKKGNYEPHHICCWSTIFLA